MANELEHLLPLVEELATRHHGFVVEHHIGRHERTNDKTIPRQSVRCFDPLISETHVGIFPDQL